MQPPDPRMSAAVGPSGPAAAAVTAGSAVRLDTLVLAIGQQDFGTALFDVLHAMLGIDRCVVIEQEGQKEPACIIDEGRSAKLSTAFLLQQAHAAWASPDAGLSSTRSHLVWWGAAAADAEGNRNAIAHISGADDVLTVTTGAGRRSYALYALSERGGRFCAVDVAQVTDVVDILEASIIKDRERAGNEFEGTSAIINRIIMCSQEFASLANREKSVCIGILTGHTTEAIGLHLGISVNSVLTYRRRLYQKLQINSQNELFMRVLKSARGL